jgi:hypothetical protein
MIKSIAFAVGSPEQKILNEGIIRLLKLSRSSVKIDAAFMQIRDPICYIERALHVMGDHDAGHSKALLQPADQSVDAVRDNRIKPCRRLII